MQEVIKVQVSSITYWSSFTILYCALAQLFKCFFFCVSCGVFWCEMVLPILIGSGVTLVALSLQSAVRAWNVYKTLSPIAIAKLNGIYVKETHNLQTDLKFQSNRLSPQLRQQLEQYYGGFHGNMNESEALLILNISSDEIRSLDKTMLKQKYRKALIQNHPDKGGSPFLTAKINEARELLSKSMLLRRDWNHICYIYLDICSIYCYYYYYFLDGHFIIFQISLKSIF